MSTTEPLDAVTTNALPSRPHLPALDGLRGLAILHVMLGHFCLNARLGSSLGWKLTGTAVGIFPNGVELFFVLSGFLITGILLGAKERQSNYFVPFYGRRAVRIFPLYYGMLIATFGTLAILIRAGKVVDAQALELAQHQGWLWAYATNFMCGLTRHPFGTRFILISHFWSLALEEQFYLVWPLLVFACRPRTMVRICIVALFATAVARGVLVCRGDKAALLYLLRPDGLLVGALLACVVRGGFDAWRWQRQAWACLIAAMVAAPLFNATVLLVAIVPRGARALNALREFAPMHAVLAFAALMVIALGAPVGSFARRILEYAPLRFFGKISYGLYVYHGFFLPLLLEYVLRRGLARVITSPLVIPVFAAVATVISVLIAYASWHVFEKQALRLKRLFPY